MAEADAVFLGKVAAIHRPGPTLRNGQPVISSADMVKVDFRVSKVWKGPRRETLTVETELSSPRVRSSGGVSAAGTSMVSRDLVSLDASIANLAGERVDAWGASGTFQARNRVRTRHSVGERAVFGGPVIVQRECAGC